MRHASSLLLVFVLVMTVSTLVVRLDSVPIDSVQPRPTGLTIDLNSADTDLLVLLPGVGPSTARRIADHRARHGPFRSVDDLTRVSGIGPATLADIRPWVTADSPQPSPQPPRSPEVNP